MRKPPAKAAVSYAAFWRRGWAAQFHGSRSASLRLRDVGDAAEHVGEPGLRIDVVELGGLCRPPNYAERARFPQHSS